ncbi:GNAT family N-acetyltransferase [Promicromonospora sp. NPDC057488]|uniref:GNAT family N-acetyltransferase n=1 Tax=Promicromonospora sp. NPDC057488 TaxID=3346147 RepID=UPI00366AB9A2
MDLELRPLALQDAPVLAAAFRALGWPGKTEEDYAAYFARQQSGELVVLVAWLGGQFAGYGCVSWRSGYPPFRDGSVPEIQDLNVLPDHRRQGVGTALLDALERLIAARSPVAGLGVGVYADYGSAMRLYIARGYQFDGLGLMSAGEPVAPGSMVRIDDDVTLMLTKNLLTKNLEV